MWYGWNGKYAVVDLSKSKVDTKELSKALALKYLGGRGFASKILFDQVPPSVDPFSPDNLLIFSVGPFLGTLWPTASRTTIAAKSPLTNALGYAHFGGFFGVSLKATGFDMIIIKGKSEKPVYLLITDDTVEIKNAEHLWGKMTSEVEKILIDEHGKKSKVASIGPAGEKLSRIAAVIHDGRAAARTGMGAIMGSKRLKAIVALGTKKINIANEEKFKEKVKDVNEKIRNNEGAKAYGEYGTSILVAWKNFKGDLPAKNHQLGNVPFANELDGMKISKTILVRPTSCFACPIHCGRLIKVDNVIFEGMEYETIDSFGPMLWISDLNTVAKLNILANDLGLDAISTGVTMAWAMELYERGILTKEDVGLDLTWGNGEAAIELIKMIGFRKGIGDILAEGSEIAARKIGKESEKYLMTVKGVELPRQEPRATRGFGLGHAVSNRGADHLYALPTLAVAQNYEAAKKLFPEEWLNEMLNPRSPKYKANMVVVSENFCAISDAVGICKFTTSETWAIFPEDVAEGLTYLTGIEFSTDVLLKIGERIVNLERAYNARHGYSRKDDKLPYRIMNEPLKMFDPDKDLKEIKIVPKVDGSTEPPMVELDYMLYQYYELRGWDKETGWPTVKKLKELELSDVLEVLEKEGISLK